MQIHLHHIPGHKGNPYNEFVDVVAKTGAAGDNIHVQVDLASIFGTDLSTLNQFLLFQYVHAMPTPVIVQYPEVSPVEIVAVKPHLSLPASDLAKEFEGVLESDTFRARPKPWWAAKVCTANVLTAKDSRKYLQRAQQTLEVGLTVTGRSKILQDQFLEKRYSIVAVFESRTEVSCQTA